MLKSIKIFFVILLASFASFAAPAPLKIKIINPELLHQATVTTEQMEKNIQTKHLYNGQLVNSEVAKKAFLAGETSCRVFLDGTSEQLKENTAVELIMEIPMQNRKMITFMTGDQTTLFSLVCQASNNDVTIESILKTLNTLVETIK